MKGGGSRNLAPLCARADWEDALLLSLGGPLTSKGFLRLRERDGRQRTGRLKKWGSRGREILIGNKIQSESLLFNFYSWNFFVVLANNSCGGLSPVLIKLDILLKRSESYPIVQFCLGTK